MPPSHATPSDAHPLLMSPSDAPSHALALNSLPCSPTIVWLPPLPQLRLEGCCPLPQAVRKVSALGLVALHAEDAWTDLEVGAWGLEEAASGHGGAAWVARGLVWPEEHRVWCMFYAVVQCIVSDTWRMACGVWCVVWGMGHMVCDTLPLLPTTQF